ncbi:hypothetical protein [Aquibium oceanicum]|nr:hypothetical protein [Aquibium oceanicum]
MRKTLALLVLTLFCAPAFADDQRAPTDDALPGVTTGSISPVAAEPQPEPDEALAAGSQPGSIRAGNWDIRISGSVSYEIGFGDRNGSRRR